MENVGQFNGLTVPINQIRAYPNIWIIRCGAQASRVILPIDNQRDWHTLTFLVWQTLTFILFDVDFQPFKTICINIA